MRSSGVEAVRTAFDWRGGAAGRERADRLRADGRGGRGGRACAGCRCCRSCTARRRGRRRSPGKGAASTPRGTAAYTRFLTALVGRYGPSGSLWAEQPALPRTPIRDWQIWNEPNLTRYWSTQPFAKAYVKLLRASRRALRAADPGSRTVLAGLPERELDRAAEDLQGGRARRVRRRRAAPVHGQAEERDQAGRVRAARDAPATATAASRCG